MPSTRLAGRAPTAPLLLALAALPVPLAAQTAAQAAVPVNAIATTSPPALTFVWPADATATGFTVARRPSGSSTWGPATTIPGAGAATTWTDATVVPGTRYEYRFLKNGSVAGRGLVTAGVEASLIDQRGRLVLLVDDTMAAPLGSRLDRLIEDLTGDGWTVLRHDVPRNGSAASVRNLVLADAAAYPGEVEAVFVLGHVPVPYSGSLAPDGHGDHNGAWPADVYYGERNGPWTDTTVNNVSASRPENRNVPGDGKFDQSLIPSDVDLQVGRVDFADMPAFAASELQLLQAYLDKDHDYRHKVFTVGQQAVVDDNFGWFSGEAFAASGWRNFSALVGTANVIAGDYFTTLNTQSGPGYVWSYGCGGGSYQSAGGIGSTSDFALSQNRSVFTMLFGSYFGDWDSTNNFLRAPLCQGWTLASAWAGRPHWSFHPMGMGQTIGFAARLSQNDNSAGGLFTRAVHIGLMGDPTLRQHVVAPPSGVAVADVWPQANVSWTPSSDAVAGYHVYRAATPNGPFTRLTPAPVAGTLWTDPSPVLGTATYLVRALKLETTPTGTYWNLSQGAFATVSLPTAPASHTAYGSGCYTISDSLYATYANAAAADAALSGQMLEFTPNGGSYVATWTSANFLLPSANATVLALGNDSQAAVPLPSSFAHPGGTTSSLHVHENGIVALAPLLLAQPGVPSTGELLDANAAAFWSWHDFDSTEPGSGAITTEQVGNVVVVTWLDVESAPAAASNPTRVQFQFDLANGVVRLVFAAISPTATGAFYGGWSPAGASVDGGAADFPAALPLAIANGNAEPLALSASPAPQSTTTQGTLVTWTVDAIPEYAPGAGIKVGALVVSFTPNPTGTPLAFVGMPDCTLWLGSLDLVLPFAGPNRSQTVALAIPPGLPNASQFFTQAVALVAPGSLPNGGNAFGATASNGVRSYVSPF